MPQGTAMRSQVRRSTYSNTTHHTLMMNSVENASLNHGCMKGNVTISANVSGFRYEYSSRKMSDVSRQNARKKAMTPRYVVRCDTK